MKITPGCPGLFFGSEFTGLKNLQNWILSNDSLFSLLSFILNFFNQSA
jgi:hypothetical protein